MRRKEGLVTPRDTLLRELIERNPSGFRLDRLPPALRGIALDDLERAISDLTDEGLVRVGHHTNERVRGREYRSVALSDVTKYPIRDTIRVGDTDFPRMIAGDIAGGEDLNAFIERLAEYEATLKRRIAELAALMTRRYWVNTATLLGAFVAVFALVLRSSEPLLVDDRGWSEVLQLKFAEIAPLALVLLIFIGALHLLLRRL